MKDCMIIRHYGTDTFHECVGEECVADPNETIPIYSNPKHAREHGWHRARTLEWMCATCTGDRTQQQRRNNTVKLTRREERSNTLKRNTQLITAWSAPENVFGTPLDSH